MGCSLALLCCWTARYNPTPHIKNNTLRNQILCFDDALGSSSETSPTCKNRAAPAKIIRMTTIAEKEEINGNGCLPFHNVDIRDMQMTTKAVNVDSPRIP